MLAALFALSSLPISLPPATNSGERLAFTGEMDGFGSRTAFRLDRRRRQRTLR